MIRHVLLALLSAVAATASAAPSTAAQAESDALKTANEAHRTRDYEQAVALYSRLLTQNPPAEVKGKAIFNLGLSYKALGRHSKAISTFRRIFQTDVNDREPGGHLMEAYRNYRPRAQWEIGNCLFAQKQYRAAIETYRRTQTRYPFRSWCGNAQAEYLFRYSFYRGLCHDWLGDPAAAVRLYFDAITRSHGLYSNPDTHRRIVDLYQAAGRMKGLRGLLDALEREFLAEVRQHAPADRQIEEDKLLRVSPWRKTRRIIDIRGMADREDWPGLVALLKIKGTVAGPDEAYARRGNFEAVEAASLLAASTEETVPLLIARLDEVDSRDRKWVYYGLGNCGTPSAVEALKARAMKETNCWWTNAVVYALSLAGEEGQGAIDELAKVARGNLAGSIARHRKGTLGQADQDIEFPPLGAVEWLPTSLGELRPGRPKGGEGPGAPEADEPGPPPKVDPEHRALVDGLDAVLEFNMDTPREQVLAFRTLVQTDIPAEGKEIAPALWNKMRTTSHPKVFAYAVMSLSVLEKLSPEGKRELEKVMKAEFPGFRDRYLRTEKGRLKVIRRLKRFFAERSSVGPASGRQAK